MSSGGPTTTEPAPAVSVVIPTRNPHPERLRRTLEGLARQTLPQARWELLLVDNASDRPWAPPAAEAAALPNLRRIEAPVLGLTPARLAGIRAARGEVLVFVDDDNVLAPDYLAAVVRRFAASPSLGACGGPVRPEWESPPPAWSAEFHGMLALRDLGPVDLVAPGGPHAPWPACAPVGAGLALRRSAALLYAERVATDTLRGGLDRTGRSLGSGGDNDLVFTALHSGLDIAYFPELAVTHLIPRGRLDPEYLGNLNAGIMRTWVIVLHLHGHCPWPPIPAWSVRLRSARAWWRARAWRGGAHRIRWRGHCGQFSGQAEIARLRPLAPA
jgi:glycosyltransferase involved in cell wall biosynthesis